MAKYYFLLEYDSDMQRFMLNDHSNNMELPHSGSSYLRIKPNDESFYGTISSHHDAYCYGKNNDLKCKGNHFQIFIEHIK